MPSLALLLAEDTNDYQRILAEEAARAAAAAGLALAPPCSAGGLGMTQGHQLFECLRAVPPPDAVLILPVVADTLRQAAALALKQGVGLVFLNRVPSFLPELRQEHPGVLLSAVTPDQHHIGVIQARQCLAVAPAARSGLLVTGSVRGPSAVERRRGLVETLGGRLTLEELEGHWTAEEAEKEVALWLRRRPNRWEALDVVVSQNDDMARGIRKAFTAAGARVPPMIGCDGLPSVGQEMVARGELVSTVVVPTTARVAVDIVARALATKRWPESTVLDSAPFPPIESLGSTGRSGGR